MRIFGILSVSLFLAGCGQFEPRLSESLLSPDGIEVSDSPEVADTRNFLIHLEQQSAQLDQEAEVVAAEMALDFNRLKDMLKNFSQLAKHLRDRIDALQDAIQRQMSKLDPQDPAQRALLDRLTGALERLNELEERLIELEARIQTSIENLLSKLRDGLKNKNPLLRFLLERVLDRLESKLKEILPPRVI